MFDFILESMQRDAAERAQEVARSVKSSRSIAIVHHLFTFAAGFVAYFVLLFGSLFADMYPKNGTKLTIAASVLSASILVTSTLLKRDPSFLNVIRKAVSGVGQKIDKAKQDNPFFVQFYLSLLFLYLPICVIVIFILLSKSPWIDVTSTTQQIFIDSVKQMITFAAVILPVQVALFTFMFAQLLGKYSSGIVGALYKAPVILLLWLYPIVSLLLLNFASLYGYPESLKGVLAFFFASLNVICLVLTIWVANTGTLTDKVVTYAGNLFSQKVRRKTKPAILASTEGKRLWMLLNYLGLDWRDPDRRTLFSPPSKAIVVTYPLLANLFNVANKAVLEGQHEVFVSALTGIKKVIAAYIEKRASYFGTADPVIAYAIDQMAALLNATSKSSNEYLITETVRCIGDGALLSLQIDVIPKKNNLSEEERMAPRNHPLTGSWMQLLGEAFELSHTLMRSTAANATIIQLERIARFAFQREYGDVIYVGFLPKIKEIFSICITRNDAYHLALAGDCITRTMGLWSVATRRYGQWACMENLNKQIADSIYQMATVQFTVEKLPSFNFSDAKTVLTSKIDRDRPIIQDIFIITIYRSFSEWWEEKEIINDLKRIIILVVNLAIEAIKNKIAGVDGITEAFYEISYLILRGLPENYKKEEKSEDTEFHRPKLSAQEILKKEIFDAWSQLFPVFFNAGGHLGLDWKQNFFGIIGIGMVRYSDQKNDSLKSALTRLIQEYLGLCLKENTNRDRGIREWGWDYLQLAGAWTLYFLKEEVLANTIAKEVAKGRPFHYSSMGIIGARHGAYGIYGYPAASLHSDFFLPWLRNLQPQGYLTDQEWDTFRLWQKMLMNEEVLMPYYNIIEKTREPLRDAFYKKMREREEMQKRD
jgi:hypothetical protein